MSDQPSTRAERLARLQTLRRPLKVALVGCGVKKSPEWQLARNLYTSSLFRASLEYAERTADEVWILSALYGLLDLNERIPPYNRSLKRLPKRERDSWAERVAGALCMRYSALELELVAYAGRDYTDPLEGALFRGSWRINGTFEKPLAGLGIGERLAWFKRQMQAPTALSGVAKDLRRSTGSASEDAAARVVARDSSEDDRGQRNFSKERSEP